MDSRAEPKAAGAEMIQGHTPFCHMVIPMVVLPAALSRTIIFAGSILEGFAAIGSMLVLWLGASLALGRGWCSWGCFYGGLDEPIDFDADGTNDFQIRLNTRSHTADLKGCDPRVLSVAEVTPVENARIVRVNLRRAPADR